MQIQIIKCKIKYINNFPIKYIVAPIQIYSNK